jgi:phosphatidylinositol 4-kinase
MMGPSMATSLPLSKSYPLTPSYAPGAIAAAAAAAKTAFDAMPKSLVGSRFSHKSDMTRFASPYGHMNGWKLDGVMAKSNDDLRQEVFTMQLLSFFQIAFQHAQIPAWVYTYRILSTTKSTGLIQLIPDAISLDELKKSPNYAGSLRAHFEKTYNYNGSGVEPPSFRKAINEYIKSMAGYSVLSYLLDIKDRHNGNIMLDSEGHLIHIDFGFVFGLAPGKAFSIEKAPFKLTEEMAGVMGGRFSKDFLEYTRQCTQALLVCRQHADTICTMLEIMSYNSFFPCFKYNPFAIKEFRARLMLDVPDCDVEYEWNRLVERSYRHSGSGLYDSFQLATNGIAK